MGSTNELRQAPLRVGGSERRLCVLWTLRHSGRYGSFISLTFPRSAGSTEPFVLATERTGFHQGPLCKWTVLLTFPRLILSGPFFFKNLEGSKCCVEDSSLMKATQSSEGVTPGAVLTGSSEHASAHEGPNPAPLHRHVIGGAFLTFPASQFPFPQHALPTFGQCPTCPLPNLCSVNCDHRMSLLSCL